MNQSHLLQDEQSNSLGKWLLELMVEEEMEVEQIVVKILKEKMKEEEHLEQMKKK